MNKVKVFTHRSTHRVHDQYGFTLKTCGRCGGSKRIAGFEHVEGAVCFKCNGHGHYFTDGTLKARYEWVAACKASPAGVVDIRPYWAQAGRRVMDAEAYRAQLERAEAALRDVREMAIDLSECDGWVIERVDRYFGNE